MLARRMLLFVAIVLAVTAVAAGLAPPPPPPQDLGNRPSDPAEPRGAGSPSAVVERTINADRPRPRTVVVEVGALLRLTVTSRAADAVQLEGLGTLQAIAPQTPVVFDVLTYAPGEYPVTLSQAGRTVGTVRVIPRKA
ncbi:MAG: hypothetical protein ACR2NB_07140 [Solirubrobacteraceae bacterium]